MSVTDKLINTTTKKQIALLFPNDYQRFYAAAEHLFKSKCPTTALYQAFRTHTSTYNKHRIIKESYDTRWPRYIADNYGDGRRRKRRRVSAQPSSQQTDQPTEQQTGDQTGRQTERQTGHQVEGQQHPQPSSPTSDHNDSSPLGHVSPSSLPFGDVYPSLSPALDASPYSASSSSQSLSSSSCPSFADVLSPFRADVSARPSLSSAIRVAARSLSGDRGLVSDGPLCPFPFMADVYSSLMDQSSVHSGVALWRLLPADDPVVCDPARSAPTRLHTLFSAPAQVYCMAWVPFNVPDQDDHPASDDTRRTFRQLYDPSSNPPMPAVFWLDDMWERLSAGQPPRKMAYLKDMEAHDVWGALREERNARDKVVSEGVPVHHFLNPKLFEQDKRNLLRILPTSARHFPGFLTASSYCKGVGSFFCAHVEQLFAPFYNYCWKGSTTWWAVVKADWAQFVRFFIQYAKTHYKLDSGRPMTEEEESLLLALLYAKRAFIDPRLMMACGIRVFHIEQQAGDVVVGEGEVVHLGMCTDSHSENEAINYMPVSWIRTGLPRLLDWMRWLCGTYIRLHTTTDVGVSDVPGAFEVVFHPLVCQLVSLHAPRAWTLEFLRQLSLSLRYHLQQPMKGRAKGTAAGRDVDYSELAPAVMQTAAGQCDAIRELLLSEEVQEWHKRHGMRFD